MGSANQAAYHQVPHCLTVLLLLMMKTRSLICTRITDSSTRVYTSFIIILVAGWWRTETVSDTVSATSMTAGPRWRFQWTWFLKKMAPSFLKKSGMCKITHWETFLLFIHLLNHINLQSEDAADSRCHSKYRRIFYLSLFIFISSIRIQNNEQCCTDGFWNQFSTLSLICCIVDGKSDSCWTL